MVIMTGDESDRDEPVTGFEFYILIKMSVLINELFGNSLFFLFSEDNTIIFRLSPCKPATGRMI